MTLNRLRRLFIGMQTRTVISKGRVCFVNVATADDGAVGGGFPVGQLVLKSYTDSRWYVIAASGSAPSAATYVSGSPLPFQSQPIYQQGALTASIVGNMDFYEQNSPFQIVASNNGLAYQVYLVGSGSGATLTVSQSAYCTASIRAFSGAIIDLAKPGLLLQSISDSNYYNVSLSTSASVTTAVVSSTMLSQSWVHPIY